MVLRRAVWEAAHTKEDLANIINVAIEELVRQGFKLPGFTTLQEEAQRGRTEVNRRFYAQVYDALGAEGRQQIDGLWAEPGAEARTTAWNALKQDVGSPTLTHLKALVDHHQWLSAHQPPGHILSGLPTAKMDQFAAEAKSLDAARMQALEPHKRYTFAAVLLRTPWSRALGDLGQMFIKRMMRIHRHGKEALALHHLKHQERTDGLIRTLRDVITAYHTDGEAHQRLAAIEAVLAGNSLELLEQCDAHEAHAGNNYYPFLWRFYASHRPTLFRIWRVITMKTTSQDASLERALAFILAHEHSRSEWLPLTGAPMGGTTLDLAWVPETWWRLVTGQHQRDAPPRRVHRRHLEVYVWTQLMWDLKSGDACIEGSAEFADYRAQLVTWDEYLRMAPAYSDQVSLPLTGDACIGQLRHWLDSIARATDQSFPANEGVRLEHGAPVLTKLPRKAEPAKLRWLEKTIANRLEPVQILDALADTEHWLHWTRVFGPLSGHEAKLDNWKDLTLYRPEKASRYEHIDALFTDTVDWDLIRTHWPDMLRVAVSIRAGRITAATILRRLGTYSRKNKLYLAFRELGRVVRSGFLLRYLADTELRATIQAATNKSEQLNRFLKWVCFGGEGIITENSRDEQRKVIKYNHLVANCLIFHNVCSLTYVISQLQGDGQDVPETALARISPYLTEHINRFGDYVLNMNRTPRPPAYDVTFWA